MKSITRYRSLGAAIAAAMTIAACSGGTIGSTDGGSNVTPSMRMATGATSLSSNAQMRHASKKHGKAKIFIRIPHKTWRVVALPLGKHRRHSHPKYISSSTQSMTVAVTGQPTQTFNLTPTASNCSTDHQTGYLSCSETAFLPIGQQTLTITLYDQTNGQGNALSQASTSVDVAAGAVTNISITLDGVVVTAQVLLNGSSSESIPQGSPTSVPASVTAYDADHNIIMSPGNYTSPVTLANSDSSGDTQLSASSVSGPGASITLSYNGGSISSATITPSINGAPQSAGAGTLTLTAAMSAITEYSIPTSSSGPRNITTGPDGALWFTEYNGDKAGRITTGGTITEMSGLSGLLVEPVGIASGPDGALWLTGYAAGPASIGRLTTDGSFTGYTMPGPPISVEPSGIVAGPDGALWFTECASSPGSGNAIGRMTTSGSVSFVHTIPAAASQPVNITVGPDQALWFAEYAGNKIGQITTAGTLTEYPISTASSQPYGITSGADGALWFTESGANKIGRITTLGAITEYTIPTSASSPHGIALGSDGALWFTELNGNNIARITTGGTVTEYPVPTAGSQPNGISLGPDSALWFTEQSGNKIGRIPVPQQ